MQKQADKTIYYIVGLGLVISAACTTYSLYMGVSALVGVGLSVGNWLAMRWVASRLLAGAVASRAGATILLLSKMGLLAGSVFILLWKSWVHPIGLVLGLASLTFGALLGGLHVSPREIAEEKI